LDKQTFLSELCNELVKLGVEDAYIKAYIGHFEKQFAKMPEDVLAKQLGSYENVKNIAISINKSIIARTAQKKASSAPVQKTVEERKEEKVSQEESAERIRMDYIDSAFDEKGPAVKKKHISGSYAMLLPLNGILNLMLAVLAILAQIIISVLVIVCGAVCLVSAIGCIILPVLGIYYGVTLLSASQAAGLYEIGLGIFFLGACFGLTAFLHLLVTKLFPALMSKINDGIKAAYRNSRVRLNAAKEGRKK